jgi:hypothetical protein
VRDVTLHMRISPREWRGPVLESSVEIGSSDWDEAGGCNQVGNLNEADHCQPAVAMGC